MCPARGTTTRKPKPSVLRGSALPPGPLPLHMRVKQDLARQIEDGTLRPGDLIPSERELCVWYGVSSITVRRALSDLAAEGCVMRQVGVGTFVTSPRRRTRLGLVIFGFVEDDWHRNRDIHGDLIGGIASASWEHAAVFSLIRAPLNTTVAPLLESLISEKLFDGFILRTAGDFHRHDVMPLLRARLPFVLVKRRLEDTSVNAVVVDEFQGGYRATKFLVDSGHRDIAFIGPTNLSVASQRYQGYLHALEESGLAVNPALVRVIPAFLQRDAYGATRELLAHHRPSAIFACGDVLAEGVYQACAEAHLTIPGDISVVGHDDYSAATRLRPPLTTMHFSYYELGVKSADLLLDVLRNRDHEPPPRYVVITPTLVVRESTAPPAKASPGS